MGRLSCRCLNVSVHYTDGAWNRRPVEASQLLPAGSADKIAQETLYELDLDVAGVTMEHKILVVNRTVGDWVVHMCTNCNAEVYVTHALKEGGRMFVTENLLSNEEDIERVRSSKDFSLAFHLVLKPVSEEEEQSYQRRRLSSNTFGREDPVMRTVHTQMKSFLNQEESAMEERIKRFEADQREAYSQLQRRIQEDRTVLFAGIARARENVISDAIKDVLPARTSPTLTPSHSTPPRVAPRPRRVSPKQQKTTVTLREVRPAAKTSGLSTNLRDPSDDVLFPMEGFDMEGEEEEEEEEDVRRSGEAGSEVLDSSAVAFPQSDDEEISTDDSSFRDVSTLAAGTGIAMSVPVGIPMFTAVQQLLGNKAPATPPTADTSGSFADPFNPEDMGHNIRVLALSVHDTGMFGDLPRPRTKVSHYPK